MLKFTPVFLCLLLSTHSHARLVDRTSALVNGEVILQSDLQSYKKNFSLRKEIDPFVGLVNLAIGENKENLDYLIQESLVLQKFPPTEEETEEEINAVQRNNKITREKLKEVLLAQGVNFDDYRQLMRVSVAKRKLVERELRPLAMITDEEVKNQYYTDSSLKERRKEQKLVLKYNLQQLLLPNSKLSEFAHKRLKAGEDFDAVASDLGSEGAESSKLGTISEENMNSMIKDSIQGLKVGESTKPISAGTGYMILKILEISAPTDPVFEREKERIRSVLFQKALLGQLKLWTERERSQSYIHIP
jgi:peptidyl-prolyl cis-trans isomerase SurA